MIKKYLICAAALVFTLSVTAIGITVTNPNLDIVKPANMPTDDMIIQSEDRKRPKPSIFPHTMHADIISCAACHHTMTDDGKIAPFDVGDIGRCASCHDGKTVTNRRVNTLMKASHAKCITCHRAEKKGPTRCNDCHVRK